MWVGLFLLAGDRETGRRRGAGEQAVLGLLPVADHDGRDGAKALLGDRGYDSGWFRAALAEKGIEACIPSSRSRKVAIAHDKALYRQRHKIENMFGRLKDWRRVATRYDRCAHAFFSAICIAATVAFWL